MSSPTSPPDYRSLLKRALLTLDELQAKLDAVERTRTEPIAVIGVGCRFPKGANDPDAFWTLLRDGVDGISEVPPARWDVDAFYDPNPGAPGKMYTRRAGFIDRVDGFDPQFFGIAPREALSMDPQQRLLLEVAWEALEHAGQSPARLGGSATGVFVGIGSTDYAQLQTRSGDADAIDTYFGSGVSHSIASGRLSYVLGLQGPSLSVDTACSSSLVAVHLACQSLRNGECRLALAGGVNLILSPDGTIATSQARMLSPDGRCKTFDAAADGYVRSEGCGLVVLKRLSDARANGDHVLAVVRGTAINQDGRSSGITAPNGPAQEAVIRDALLKSGLQGSEVDYVEAHGTGTSLGDPIEVRALGAVLGPGRDGAHPLGIGSVKSNIGHLEAAAGIAGFIKMILALDRGEIPPHLHLKTPNPYVPWSELPVRVVSERTPWPAGRRRRIAGVSSFGFSGTNCHLILEEPSAPEAPRAERERPLHVLALSARTESALGELSARYGERLSMEPAPPWADVCFTANAGRSHFPHRLAIVAGSVEEARQALAGFAAGQEAAGARVGQAPEGGRPEVAFLFTGQGSQYVGMGRELYETQPTFRKALERCDAALRPRLERPLLSVLYPKEGEGSPLDETGYTQPALFALEWSLSELWRSWGVEPSLVLGHSVGEYVAACVAGVFSLEEGLGLVAERGRLMQSLPGGGAMAAVLADEARVMAALVGREGRVSVAAVNGPENVVISGEGSAVREVVELLAKEGLRSKALTVSHAFHSPLMDPILDAFEAAAAGIAHAAPRIGLVSNVTGRMAEPGEMESAAYWRRHVREPVRFSASMRTLHEQGPSVLIELGPRATLLGMGRRCVPEGWGVWLPSLRRERGDWRQILESLAALYVQGADFDWAAFDRDYPRRRRPQPTYPFQRQRYWLDSATRGARPPLQAASAEQGGTGHPLLGRRLRSALPAVQFESLLGAGAPSYLQDHTFYGRPVCPATAYVEMALKAAEALGPGQAVLEDLRIEEPLVFADGEVRPVQSILDVGGQEGAAFRVSSQGEARQGGESWRLHASARLRLASPDGVAPAEPLADVQARCRDELAASEYYETFRALGVGYGPRFQAIASLWRRDGEALGRLRLPEALRAEAQLYRVHPVLLDAGFQLLGAALFSQASRADASDVYMPVGIERLSTLGALPETLWAQTSVSREGEAELRADVSLRDESGRTCVLVQGLRLRRARREALERVAPRRCLEWIHELAWLPEPASPAASDGAGVREWVVLADAGGTGARLAARLREQGHRCLLVTPGAPYAALDGDRLQVDPLRPEDFQRLVAHAGRSSGGPWGVVHLWGLEAASPDDPTLETLAASQALACGGALHLVQALIRSEQRPRLWIVTRGAQAVGGEAVPLRVAQAPLWGLGRSLALEHPELGTRRVDLDPGDADDVEGLVRELTGGDEDQVALRGGVRHVARLRGARSPETSGPTGAVELRISSRGVLDNLRLEPVDRRPPGPAEVEIRVRTSGLNFRDVLNALGMYPGDPGPLGSECAGTVTAVGPGVEGLAVGDEVLAMAPAAFASFAVTSADFVVRRPDAMSAEEAATIPIAFLTAHYALDHLGRIAAGERVLIHAAAGGVGLAAVQLVRRAGATVFATAGSAEKRSFLRSLGVAHVMDSRSLDFADEVTRLTGGEGVDVVLNSLTGEFIPKSLSVLRGGGRFLEIGRRGVWDPEQVASSRPDVAYHVIYLGEVAQDRPGLVKSMLSELMAGFAAGSLQPLPRRAFPIGEAAAAFRHMAMARHIGKVVLEAHGPRGPGEGPVRRDATYLVTGGLGALGLASARWLVDQGARHVVLAGRSAPDADAVRSVGEMEAAGAEVRVVTADVSREEDVRRLLAGVAAAMPPLRGILHSAGVLDDGVLLQQDWARFARVMAPKVQGAWNLHVLSRGMPLDFFILYSSAASLLGSPGQGNYAAANAFLDGLAHHRRAQGLRATSINWGAWGDSGMAAAQGDRDQRRRVALGAGVIPPAEGVQALDHILRQDPPQVAVLPIDWPRFLGQFPSGGVPPLFSLLVGGSGKEARDGRPAGAPAQMRRRLEDAAPAERGELLLAHVREQVVRVLGLDPARPPSSRQGLTDIGMDSLMAVELRNRLEASLGCSLPSTLAFEHPNIEALTGFLSGRVFPPAPVAAQPGLADRQGEAMAEAELSPQELEASLLNELDRAGY